MTILLGLFKGTSILHGLFNAEIESICKHLIVIIIKCLMFGGIFCYYSVVDKHSF